MEHAPLRPLPSRPTRPADPDLARRYVAARLPGLDAQAATALALVELARVQSDQAARELGLGAEDLGAALARARKELRRSRRALAGSGWCERAERLISDRLDGELAPLATRRLDAHLRNCPRCVEHELRLTQAIDELVASMPAPAKPAGALRLVLPTVQALPPGRPREELQPADDEPAQAPDEPSLEAAPDEPSLEAAPDESPSEQAPPTPGTALRPVAAPPAAPSAPRVRPSRAAGPPPPAPLNPDFSTQAPVRAPRPLADPRPVAALIGAFAWHIAFALALTLALAAIAITAIGIGGGL
ncbi:MAG TPA: zf-HC2 domain-containing protein [Thermoleophilaceae bacterium]|nr:zf-HC2 domain-containing protein [Thermoleophilaceae bacterium]